MKKTSLLIAFVLVGYIANAQTKTGTIDADFILAQMPAMEEVELGLQNYNTEMQEDLKESIKEYEGLIEVYQKDRETLTEEERAEKEKEIIGLENEIKGFRQRASVMMQIRRNELTKPLYDEINKAMQLVIQEEAYTQIFHANGNSLAFADERYDITEKVLDKLGIDINEVQKEE